MAAMETGVAIAVVETGVVVEMQADRLTLLGTRGRVRRERD
jgi:hypothetical protein